MTYLVPTGLVSLPVTGVLVPTGLVSVPSALSPVPVSSLNNQTLVVGLGQTVTVNNSGTAATSLVEVAGATSLLADFDYEIKDADTIGPIGAGDPEPLGAYPDVKLKQVNAAGDGNTISVNFTVVQFAGGDSGPVETSPVESSIVAGPVQSSPVA